MTKKVYELTLLRHRHSQADDEGRMEGRYDSSLTEKGRQQAEELAHKWKHARVQFDSVITSTLCRVQETAKIICDELGISPATDSEDWMEKDSGCIAGMLKHEANKRYPMPPFISPYERIVAGTGESLVQLHSRAATAVQSILLMPPGKYLIVSHGEMLNAALRCMLSIPIPRNAAHKQGTFFRFGNTSYARLSYDMQSDKWVFHEFVC